MLIEGFLTELNANTRRHIVPNIVDNVFKNDPLIAQLKANRLQKFPGGTQIQENFLYASLPTMAYSMGQTFPVTRRQTATGGSFEPKLYAVPVTEYKEVIQIFNKGPEAVFRIIDIDLQNAALSMSARLAVDLYNGGQTTRVQHMNGLAEILNDGTNASWDTSIYANYGTVPRNGIIGSALNSPLTSPTSSVAGPITYKLLEEGYNSVCIGDEHPDLIVTTNLGMSYIKQRFQPQWRVETQNPKIGFNGIVFNQAMIHQSQYCPGTQGVDDPNIGNYNASAGETLFMLNSKYFTLWVTDDPEFGFGFTGFKVAQDNTVVSGQYLYSGNVTCRAPRLSRHFFGITA